MPVVDRDDMKMFHEKACDNFCKQKIPQNRDYRDILSDALLGLGGMSHTKNASNSC